MLVSTAPVKQTWVCSTQTIRSKHSYSANAFTICLFGMQEKIYSTCVIISKPTDLLWLDTGVVLIKKDKFCQRLKNFPQRKSFQLFSSEGVSQKTIQRRHRLILLNIGVAVERTHCSTIPRFPDSFLRGQPPPDTSTAETSMRTLLSNYILVAVTWSWLS